MLSRSPAKMSRGARKVAKTQLVRGGHRRRRHGRMRSRRRGRRRQLREKRRTAHLATHAKHRRVASHAQHRVRRRRAGRRRWRRRRVRVRLGVARLRERLGRRVAEQDSRRRRNRVGARARRDAGFNGISTRQNTRGTLHGVSRGVPSVVDVEVTAEPARVARTLRRLVHSREHRRRGDGGVLVARRSRRLTLVVRLVRNASVGAVSVRHRASSLAAVP